MSSGCTGKNEVAPKQAIVQHAAARAAGPSGSLHRRTTKLSVLRQGLAALQSDTVHRRGLSRKQTGPAVSVNSSSHRPTRLQPPNGSSPAGQRRGCLSPMIEDTFSCLAPSRTLEPPPQYPRWHQYQQTLSLYHNECPTQQPPNPDADQSVDFPEGNVDHKPDTHT